MNAHDGSDERPWIRGLRHVVMAGFLVGTPFVELMMIRNLIDARRSNGWPTTDGTVTRSEVKWDVHKTSPVFSPDVSYEYHVGDRTFQSSQVNVGNLTTKSKRDAETIVERYPAGKTVAVHYDPDNPSACCLVPGADWTHYLVVVSPILFWVVSIGYFHQMWRNHKTRKDGAEVWQADQ